MSEDLSLVLSRISPANLSAEDLYAYARAQEVLKSARHAKTASGDHWRRLRAFTRFLQGVWDASQTAEALNLEVDRVREEAQDWARTEPYGEPLSAYWVRPARHPWLAQARKAAEAESDKRDVLRARLILRMKVVSGVMDEQKAAGLAKLSLAEWQLFCASEDAASPDKDHKYREGWVLDGEEADELD